MKSDKHCNGFLDHCIHDEVQGATTNFQHKLDLTATSLEAETISKDVINVHLYSSTLTNRLIPIQDITKSKYQYIILGPDLLLGNLLKSLWKNSKFVACINCIIVDDAHCVTQWLTFHSKYQDLCSLYVYLQSRCQWYLTSAPLMCQLAEEYSLLSIWIPTIPHLVGIAQSGCAAQMTIQIYTTAYGQCNTAKSHGGI